MLKLSKLLWVVLLACASLALGNLRAEAREGLASNLDGSPRGERRPDTPGVERGSSQVTPGLREVRP
jgi:hypothetical protein